MGTMHKIFEIFFIISQKVRYVNRYLKISPCFSAFLFLYYHITSIGTENMPGKIQKAYCNFRKGRV